MEVKALQEAIQSILPWLAFNALILALLALDLLIFQRKPRKGGLKEALLWSGAWIGLALLFNLGIYYFRGSEAALQFLTGYLIEKSLSVDNLFVFLMVFSTFGVKPEHQHKVLYCGILGALIMRAAFIFAGIGLLHKFHSVIYVFGAFLIYSGIKMAVSHGQKELDPENSRMIRIARRVFPFTSSQNGAHFTRVENGKRLFTPLFLVLVVIELSDIVFAVDSIPAVLAITPDPLIVYSSNAFAILGLRALYFALSELVQLLSYLHYGLAAVLVFVGGKMLLSEVWVVPTSVTLLVIFVILGAATLASRIWPKPKST